MQRFSAPVRFSPSGTGRRWKPEFLSAELPHPPGQSSADGRTLGNPAPPAPVPAPGFRASPRTRTGFPLTVIFYFFFIKAGEMPASRFPACDRLCSSPGGSNIGTKISAVWLFFFPVLFNFIFFLTLPSLPPPLPCSCPAPPPLRSLPNRCPAAAPSPFPHRPGGLRARRVGNGAGARFCAEPGPVRNAPRVPRRVPATAAASASPPPPPLLLPAPDLFN